MQALYLLAFDSMSSSPLLPLPAGLEIATIETIDDLLMVTSSPLRTSHG
jgi:hypothetical protein